MYSYGFGFGGGVFLGAGPCWSPWGAACLSTPRNRTTPIAPPEPQPDACCEVAAIAGPGGVAVGDAVFVNGIVGNLAQLTTVDGSTQSVQDFVGYARTAAAAGQRFIARVSGPVTLATVPTGNVYLETGSGSAPVLFGQVTTGNVYRPIGTGIGGNTLILTRGGQWGFKTDSGVPLGQDGASGALFAAPPADSSQEIEFAANFGPGFTAIPLTQSGRVGLQNVVIPITSPASPYKWLNTRRLSNMRITQKPWGPASSSARYDFLVDATGGPLPVTVAASVVIPANVGGGGVSFGPVLYPPAGTCNVAITPSGGNFTSEAVAIVIGN